MTCIGAFIYIFMYCDFLQLRILSYYKSSPFIILFITRMYILHLHVIYIFLYTSVHVQSLIIKKKNHFNTYSFGLQY